MTTRNRLPLIALLLVLHPLAAQTTTATLHGDPAHPAHAARWVDTRLYFGMAPEGDTRRASSDAQWQEFLDREVTPRFPAGLSVIDVNGQWQGAHQATPEHVRTKLLVIDYPDTPANAAKIEAIRTAWKQRTHDQSVLKVTQPADVSF
ncbi:MAG: DUF3574 domain-containing protein [Acidobacteriota bacterium]|nr:DUF3574 domain-containing protein [Acidobacteriota bacterium]